MRIEDGQFFTLESMTGLSNCWRSEARARIRPYGLRGSCKPHIDHSDMCHLTHHTIVVLQRRC